MEFSEDAPLGQEFDRNPLQFMQNYVKNMNNELFLSEYQINNLYALLLIGRSAPWDSLKPITDSFKQDVNNLVDGRVNEVSFLLQKLSQIYEEKVKKNAFSQIERLMSIIRARNKSIFIQKNFVYSSCSCPHNQKPSSESDREKEEQGEEPKPIKNQEHQEHHEMEEEPSDNQVQVNSDETQVFGLFAGLANISNLSAMALGNCLQYNSTQRFIKFKMTKNYIMTIKNEDPVSYDLTSRVAKVPANMFIHHIFPYLSAWELFRVRGVCKQWLVHVKEAWHSTFKRQMYVQLLACQLCKDIEFYYKCIQLRNPFFHKLSLLMHALIEIIEWNTISEALVNNTINFAFKRVLLIFLRLLGENIKIDRINDLTEQVWQQHKDKVPLLKDRITNFFTNLNGTNMSINELRLLKTNILDHPFIRGQELQTQNKTPLLLLIFIKQLALQQLLKNHLYFSQEYLLNSKKRLDGISAKMHNRKGFLEGVYKVLLLRTFDSNQEEREEEPNEMPSFHEMIQSIFQNKESDKPDFVIKTKNSKTNIYMDKATKLDIIISTVKKIQEPKSTQPEEGVEMGEEGGKQPQNENNE